MPGFHAELDAMGAAAGVLRETVDSVGTARDQLDTAVCASLGPGRLGAVAARIVEHTRAELDRVYGSIVEDAELVTAAARGYAELDRQAADAIIRRTDEPS